MSTQIQLETVARLIEQGYIAAPPADHRHIFGGPARLRSPEGKLVEVHPDGKVTEVSPPPAAKE